MGRTVIYRLTSRGVRSVIAFLVNDCRDGHPELCNLVAADAAACVRWGRSPLARRGTRELQNARCTARRVAQYDGT